MLLIHGSHDKGWGSRHLCHPGGTHPVLALVNSYCQHVNTRRKPGQSCSKLVLHTRSPMRIGNAPISRLLARGNTSPYTTFDNFFSVAPCLAHPSDLWPQTPPCFLPCGVGRRGA